MKPSGLTGIKGAMMVHSNYLIKETLITYKYDGNTTTDVCMKRNVGNKEEHYIKNMPQNMILHHIWTFVKWFKHRRWVHAVTMLITEGLACLEWLPFLLKFKTECCADKWQSYSHSCMLGSTSHNIVKPNVICSAQSICWSDSQLLPHLVSPLYW